jgi:DNA repair protein RadC
MNRVLINQVMNRNIIGSWGALLEYLKFNMGNLQIEQFRILFLNKKNSLIADEIMATGTIDQTPVYPREIIKRILVHEAGAIILVHNHPSGSAKPSTSDIELTVQIVNACKTVNVSVHDHVIIGRGEYYSFKTNMLL